MKLLSSCLELFSLRTIYISADISVSWTTTNLYKAKCEVTWWHHFVLILPLFYARNDLRASQCYPSVNRVLIHGIFILLSVFALWYCWHKVAVDAIRGWGIGAGSRRGRVEWYKSWWRDCGSSHMCVFPGKVIMLSPLRPHHLTSVW